MHTHPPASNDVQPQRSAMRWSLTIGLLMFVGKGLAYLLTGSAAILSDAAESVVHVVAVGFAAYSLWLSHRPPDRNHLYGHEKIGYFSAGFEGAMIILAALFITYESIAKWIRGLELEQIELGGVVVLAATVVNGILGMYLIRTGRREGSLILVANGKHVLSDSITSFGVILALVLIWFTGRKEFDPIFAIAIALHILWSGLMLMRQSFQGLMDEGDPRTDLMLRGILNRWASESGGEYHDLRHRSGGHIVWIEVHLLFPGQMNLESAHAAATRLEEEIERELRGRPAVVTTHLEPLEKHSSHHPAAKTPAAVEST